MKYEGPPTPAGPHITVTHPRISALMHPVKEPAFDAAMRENYM